MQIAAASVLSLSLAAVDSACLAQQLNLQLMKCFSAVARDGIINHHQIIITENIN